MQAQPSKVIWAVDAFSHNKDRQLRTARELARWTHRSSSIIEPVCVVGPDHLLRPAAAFIWNVKQHEREAREIVEAWVRELGITGMTAPTLLLHEAYSKNDSALRLLSYARDTEAKLIAVGTHTRGALERLLIGAFTESLVSTSEIPVLTVNPHAGEGTGSPESILFPTDFSAGCWVAYQSLLHFALQRSAKVFLFFKCGYLVPETSEQLLTSPTFREFFNEDMAEKREMAESWAALATQLGVQTEIIISEDLGFVPESIFAAARTTGAGLIAMASHRGRLSSTVLGSTTRHVVRHAHVPVWVMHPHRNQERYAHPPAAHALLS